MKVTRKSIFNIVMILFIVGLAVNSFYEKYQLENDHEIISYAKVYGCKLGGRGKRGRIYIQYSFFLNDKEVKAEALLYMKPTLSLSEYEDAFIGMTFPVAYNSENPSNNRILISRTTFNDFDIPYPDSLYWTLKYFPE